MGFPITPKIAVATSAEECIKLGEFPEAHENVRKSRRLKTKSSPNYRVMTTKGLACAMNTKPYSRQEPKIERDLDKNIPDFKNFVPSPNILIQDVNGNRTLTKFNVINAGRLTPDSQVKHNEPSITRVIEKKVIANKIIEKKDCLLYTSPSPRDKRQSRMPSSA